jgi:hypothetical protein
VSFFNLQPHLPPIAIGLLALAGALAVAFLYRRSRYHLLPNRARVLLALRSLLLAALIITLLNPFTARQQPDPEGFRVVTLLDASGSMDFTDEGKEQSRLEEAAERLDARSGKSIIPLLSRLSQSVERRRFAANAVPWETEKPASSLPGPTAIGEAMASLLQSDEAAAQPIGAVILLSDGINQGGISPFEVAKRYAARNVPVSVLGVGSTNPSGDSRVELNPANFTLRLEERLDLPVVLSLDGTQPVTGDLKAYLGELLLSEVQATLSPGNPHTVPVPVEGLPEGTHALRIEFIPEVPEAHMGNNTAYATVEVVPESSINVLYLGSRLDYPFRFLRLLAEEEDDIRFRAAVQVAPERILLATDPQPGASGSEDLATPDRTWVTRFPDSADFYFEANCIVMDPGLPELLNETQIRWLRDFVDQRGGGLLVLDTSGTTADIPDELRQLLPVRTSRLNEQSPAFPLAVSPELVFQEVLDSPLFTPPPPVIPIGSSWSLPGELSRSARPVLSLALDNVPLLAVHAYGAGRIAWSGVPISWRWRMAGGHPAEQYAVFWEALLGWLATGSRERIDTPLAASVIASDSPTAIAVEIKGPGFSPRADAIVQLKLEGPDGEEPAFRLQADLSQPGRYTAERQLETAGTWKARVEALFPEGDQVVREFAFTSAPLGSETRDVQLREQALRDIARITGGRYASLEDSNELLKNLSVSANIPKVETRNFWTQTVLWLMVLLLLAAADWAIRRRSGLR